MQQCIAEENKIYEVEKENYSKAIEEGNRSHGARPCQRTWSQVEQGEKDL